MLRSLAEMATGGKLYGVWSISCKILDSVWWSAVALFCENVFWAFLGLLSETCRFLHELLEHFITIARGPREREVRAVEEEPMHPVWREDTIPDVVHVPTTPRKSEPRFEIVQEELGSQCYGYIPHFQCSVPWHCKIHWYVVVKGRNPGIYECWEDTEKQVSKFSRNKHKAFKSKQDAEQWYLQQQVRLHQK